ncbi:MAG TPA: (2Fe-2S)-binding protein [bacterium]|nr:(2Fe-2S)-binding protein [bacterium]
MTSRVHLVVNGTPHELEVDPSQALVHVLRDQLRLTGTRFGCLTGHCGACTVRLDGRAVKSCTVLAASADGARIETIEGLAADGTLHPLQRAFWERFGFQCGFCTPGMIMTALEILAEHPHPDEATIRRLLGGNLCRCTGYQTIVEAIQAASEAAR